LDYRYVTQYEPTPPTSGDGKRRGRKPRGERALAGAERQARYRQRQAEERAAALPRPIRPQRWRAAVAELLALQTEYATWLDALPEGLRNGATGEALQAIIDLDLDELVAIEPPRGFGRD
jgi:hypothetical protein